MHIPIHKSGQPFFSVIIRTYNRANVLPRALDSLLGQTESDWEALIVDDGSSDDTFAVVRDYLPRMPRLRYMYHANKGQAYAANTGITSAVGRYITWLDSDDYYQPEHLAIRKQILLDDPAILFLHGGVQIIGDPYVADKYDYAKKVYLPDCPIGGTFVVRSDLMREMGGYPIVKFGIDSDFFENAVAQGIEPVAVEAPTYVYDRTSPDSVCTIIGQGGLDALTRYRQQGMVNGAS